MSREAVVVESGGQSQTRPSSTGWISARGLGRALERLPRMTWQVMAAIRLRRRLRADAALKVAGLASVVQCVRYC